MMFINHEHCFLLPLVIPCLFICLLAVREWDIFIWKNTEIVVLDEADRILDFGFKEDITRILSKLPKQRRTVIFLL